MSRFFSWNFVKRFIAEYLWVHALELFLALHIYANLNALQLLCSIAKPLLPSIVSSMIDQMLPILTTVILNAVATAITWRQQPAINFRIAILSSILSSYMYLRMGMQFLIPTCKATSMAFLYLPNKKIVAEKFLYCLLNVKYYLNKITHLFIRHEDASYLERQANIHRQIIILNRERESALTRSINQPKNTNILDYYVANPSQQKNINIAIARDLYKNDLYCMIASEDIDDESNVILTLATSVEERSRFTMLERDIDQSNVIYFVDNYNLIRFNIAVLKNTEETRNWLNTQTNDIYGSPIVAVDTGKLKDIKEKFRNLAPTQPNLWLPNFYALRAKVITDKNFAIAKKNFYRLTSLTAI